MPSIRAQKHRLGTAVLVLAAAAAGSAACRAGQQSAGRVAARDTARGVLAYATAAFRYEYDLRTGRESLFERCDDDHRFADVATRRADVAAACRRALEDELGVPDLSALRRADADREALAHLRAIGYL